MVATRSSTLPGFQIVVAHDRSNGIGQKGTMPWNLPEDMAYFKSLTATTRTPGSRNVVIMGRATWESIPPKFRPLQNRINVVISRSHPIYLPMLLHHQCFRVPNTLRRCRSISAGDHAAPGTPEHVASSFESALSLAAAQDFVDTVFVIGGGQVYAEAIRHAACSALHVTEILSDFKCDTFFPQYLEHFKLWSSRRNIRCKDHRISFKCCTR